MAATPVVPTEVLEEAARRFALLGDATRLRLVSVLHERGEVSVGDLAEHISASVPNVSQHLNRLLLGGIVKRRREGRTALYAIADPTIEGLCSVVCSSVSDRARVMSS